MSKTDPTLRLARRIAADAITIPRAVETWLTALRLATADGWPNGGTSGPRPVNHVSDPVGEMATANTTGTGPGYRPVDEHELVVTQLRIIDAALAIITDTCSRRHIHHGDTPTCSGGHLPGANIPRSEGGWHDATCDKPASLYRRESGDYAPRRDGLCDTCARRRDRWVTRDDVA
jgi:hypothetical protein